MEFAGRLALAGGQLAGLVLSALLVIVTYTNPQQVEERLQDFAVAKVEAAAHEAWEKVKARFAEGGRAERLGALAERFARDADGIDDKRRQIVPALLAPALSGRCRENCDFWTVAARVADSAMVQRIARLRVGRATLQDYVVERYQSTVRGLMTDLRRFGLVNVVTLSLMIGLVLFRPRLDWRFTAFSVVVTGYIAWAAYGYVFDQNWALTILMHDWAAPAYQTTLIFASCLFFDWLFLAGAVSTTVVNAIVSILPG